MPWAKKEAVAVVEEFRIHIPLEIRTKIELIEENAWLDWMLLPYVKIDAKITPRILDTGTSLSKNTK